MNSVRNLNEALTRSNKYYTDANYGYPYTESNCTTYAYDTALYLLDQGKIALFNRSGYGNACNWYDQYKFEKGATPKVGAIACWQTSDSGNQYGHVAIVAAVNSNGTIDVVQGAYNGDRFSRVNNYNYKRSNFEGFCYLPNYVDPTPTPTKSIEEVAKEVIAGKWGNGADRKARLIAAGYDYDAVQAKVNELLHPTPTKSVEEVAKEVIDGKWGNGADRKKKLEAAGYDYNEVQNKVNELLHSSSKKSVDEIAREVLNGKWGNGADRKKRLTEAGYNYEEVQKRVNELC